MESNSSNGVILEEVAATEENESAECEEFKDFNASEYNLFWALQLVMIFCTIYLVRGDITHCLNVFFKVINPLTWM